MGSARRSQSLSGKRIVLTGAAHGIGAATARRLFLREGASLVLVDRDGAELEQVARQLEQELGDRRLEAQGLEIHVIDLADQGARQQLIEVLRDVREEQRRIDGLINNAGVIYAGSFRSMELAQYEQVMAINLDAAVQLIHGLLPQLIEARGAIVNVASGAGLVGPGGLAAYSASKFALVGFSEALRAEVGAWVSVSTLCPAFVATDMVRRGLVGTSLDRVERERSVEEIHRLVHRLGIRPEQVSAAIVDGMKRRRGLMPLGSITRVLWGVKKWAPDLADRLNRRFYSTLRQRGFWQ
jgi:short-subunit dehydrogenase